MQHRVTKCDGETVVEFYLTTNGREHRQTAYSAVITYQRGGRRLVSFQRDGREFYGASYVRTSPIGRWTKPAFEADVVLTLGKFIRGDQDSAASNKAFRLAMAVGSVLRNATRGADEDPVSVPASYFDALSAAEAAVRS